MKIASLVGMVTLLCGCVDKQTAEYCPETDSPYSATQKIGSLQQRFYGEPSLCISDLRRNKQDGPARVLGFYSDCSSLNDLGTGTFKQNVYFDTDGDGYEDMYCILEGYSLFKDYSTMVDETKYSFDDRCWISNLDEQTGMEQLEQLMLHEVETKRGW